MNRSAWIVGLILLNVWIVGLLVLVQFPLAVVWLVALGALLLLSRPGTVETVETVAPRETALTLRVVSTRGACPRGYQPGALLTIDRQGQAVPPLCRPALAALSPLLQGGQERDNRQATCQCPLDNQAVTFALAIA